MNSENNTKVGIVETRSNNFVLTPDQEFICKRFSRGIGIILSIIETADLGDQALRSLKRLVQDEYYNVRRDMLVRFTSGDVVKKNSQEG